VTMTPHEVAPSMAVPLFVFLVLTLCYLAGVRRRGAGGTSAVTLWRTVSWCLGGLLLALGLSPHLLPFPEGDVRQHMLQHLLLGMAAPLGLVMAAPVTVLLRNVPARVGRVITVILQSRGLQLLANPATALMLNIGGMGALYFTPLYTMMMASPALHYAVHFHFVAASCLYVWVIAGPDGFCTHGTDPSTHLLGNKFCAIARREEAPLRGSGRLRSPQIAQRVAITGSQVSTVVLHNHTAEETGYDRYL